MRSCRTRSASVSFPFFLIVTSQQELDALERLDDVADAEQALIYREEVVQLLFGLSDIVESLKRIEMLLGGDDEEEGEAD